MWSKTLQKLISFTLIFALLFSITLRVPFEFFLYTTSYANEKDFYNIVSLIVDEDTYDDVKSKLIRYSRDVQAVLENTRVVILPTPTDASMLDIASLNESLYFEGYKGVKDDIDFESRLIGTVLVGNIPLPTVFDSGKSSSSILPYIDFEDKAYIYSHDSLKYEKSTTAGTELIPEVWHGVISPNTGTDAGNIEALENYFDKNHDFYTGNGVFDESLGVLNGKDDEISDTYEPYVFYYDQFRENEALQYEKYVGYEAYLRNIEDMSYKRYSKELAEDVKNDVLGIQNQTIADLLINVDPEFDISGLTNGPDTSASSDILTRYITDNTTKKFLEIFNGSTLSDMRKQVYNAGRYNEGGSRVHVDMPPFLISILDQVSSEVIKNVNTALETEITSIVASGLSRDIQIPVRIQGACGPSYENFYYGLGARGLTSAEQCSIYRGSVENDGQLTEASRGRNINLIQADTELCAPEMRIDPVSGVVTRGIESVWGGNTPVNLAGSEVTGFEFTLGTHNPQHGITPLYDILGSQKIDDASKVPSPLDCFQDGTFIQVEKKEEREHTYTVEGRDGDREERTHNYCNYSYIITVPDSGVVDVPGDIDYYRSLPHDDDHEQVPIEKAQSLRNFCQETEIEEISMQELGGLLPSSYKQITSYIVHDSPNDTEFGAQTTSLFTPSLPVDKNRYIDFIGANGIGPDFGYQRIDFPQLFRVNMDNETPMTLEATAARVESYLDEISDKINNVRASSDPSVLSGDALTLYNTLSTGDFPDGDIDLYEFLNSKPSEHVTQNNQSKGINYLDTLIFSVFWNNLNTPSAKYKFIFEEYLSNEFTGNNHNFLLPKAKKSYEIGYFAAPGDAQNMYIKLDPELKGTHPYADILSANLALQTTLLTANAADPRNIEGVFECAPPGGVNIFQWIPAVICWLENMLPPTIKIGQGSCGGEDLFLDEDELAEIDACQGDVNKNGIIDCIEQKLAGGSLSLTSSAGRYFYNSAGVLTNQVYTGAGKLARFDSNSYINTTLSRVEVPLDPSIPFSSTNSRVVFDRDIPSLSGEVLFQEAQKYVSFTDTDQRVYGGENTAYFYAKGQDANIYFSSSLQHVSSEGNTVIDLQSNTKKVEIRGERILVSSYGVENTGEHFADNSVVASNLNNICVVDGSKDTLSTHTSQARALSNAEEKLLLLIQNYSLSGNILELNYPLDIELRYGDEIVYSQTGINESSLSSVLPIFAASTAGRYELIVQDSVGFMSQRTLDITPDTAVEISPTLATSIAEIGGNISTHLFTILDQFNNAASGEIYSVDISISGDGLVFAESGTREINYNVIDGYKAFRLKSTDEAGNNTLDFTLRNLEGDIIDTHSEQIRTIDNIDIDFNLLGDQAIVGGEEVLYNVRFTDSSDNLLTDLNSRVYFSINKLYGSVTSPYVEVVGGVAQVSFIPSTLAARDIPVELQLEGGNEIYSENISILPEEAIKIHLALSKDKMEASIADSSLLEATLKDRYDNDVFTDSTTQLSGEIAEKSINILSLDTSTKTVVNGKAQFRISGTDTPGLGYFKISSSPDIGNNSFDLIGQAPFDAVDLFIPTMKDASGDLTSIGRNFFQVYSETKLITKFITKSRLESSDVYKDLPSVLQAQVSDFWDTTNALRVNGIGENAGSIETFFFWDKDDIEGNAYNTLYSSLLGAPYGDITQENYLGGAILFDRDNNALAVTSLLQTPFKFHDVFSFQQNGSIEIQRSGDITQDINMGVNLDSEGRLVFDIHNEALEDYIGRAYYNLSDTEDITFTLRDDSYLVDMFSGENARVTDANGKTVFEILETGRFTRFAGASLELDSGYEGEGLNILLSHGGNYIGEILLNKKNLATNVTRESSILDNKLAILDDTIIVYMQSNSYSTRIKKISQGQDILQVYYRDPFAAQYSLDDFHSHNITGIESVYDESGIGWQDSNTMLLSFAAGESVGEATKNFQSFSLINLGDPVVSLTAQKNTFPGSTNEKSFDATVGEIIKQDETLIGYQVFDYNADERQDILTIHRDGYLKLYEQRSVEGDFIYHGSYGYASDGASVRTVKTGDFTGDGYADIFFVTESGEAALFNNISKDISRIEINDQFSLSGSIIQVESYDMDSDGNDDLATLDDAGEINIFYGGGSFDAPVFTKKFIGDGYSIKLSENDISHGGAIYYDGLIQVSDSRAQELLLNSSEYLEEYRNSIDGVGSNGVYTPPTPDLVDTALVDSFLYIGLPYVPTDGDPRNIDQRAIVEGGFEQQISDIADSVPSENLDESVAAIEEFVDSYDDYITYKGFNNSHSSLTYFLRSQYADSEGIEITKSFIDTTPPNLQTGDTIYFDISIRNTSTALKNNIAYVDTLPQFFSFVGNEFEVISEGGRKLPRKYGVGQYNMILDGFSLAPGEETVVRYELQALPLSYGHIQVGLYEEGEVGDDEYGDILVKEDNTNCGQEADIYRSSAVRSYIKGLTTPSCNTSDVDIGNTFPELRDDNNNGLPDYLETLLIEDGDGKIVPSNDSEALQNYANEVLTDFGIDSDSDGVPDRDDSAPNTDSAVDFMGALANINETIDDIAGDIDTLIEGLSCGFGGGSCFANPLNWAPLAPGNDPTLFGMPIGDGLHVNEGSPIFSALTGRQASCGLSPCCLPSVYPATSQAFVPGPFCGASSAGGRLGTWSPTNFVRLFVTPTLTGGVGLAACFGGPAIAAGNANPIGVHPIVPGGNCIIAAMPLLGCEGGEGDPGVEGYPYPGGDFSVIHANCDGTKAQERATPLELESQFVLDYLNYQKSGVQPAGMYDRYKEVFGSVTQHDSGNYYLPTEPLISIGGGGEGSMSSIVTLDSTALASGSFGDVIQVTNTRVAGFPGFMMDWVERQLDEVTSKLTNLPKIFVILPDFGGIFDFSWENFPEQTAEAFQNERAENAVDRASSESTLASLRAQRTGLDCSGADRLRCSTLDLQIATSGGERYANSGRETLSGIKEVYAFLGNIPLVNIETETIHVNVPWPDPTDLDRAIVDWELSLEQYRNDIQNAANEWSLGATCIGTPAEIARCQQNQDVGEQIQLQAGQFLDSLQTNIGILHEYKEFPDRLADLINIKEVWLEQILCNIEAISSLLGEWISTNGERFKAWVELYILIKAVLKSWQLFIDVFTGYEAECHECKNERQDLQNFLFQLVSAVIPSPPVIEFPKWPDIILDLHNVRAGINIYLPDFQMNLRPIVLPTLPGLSLPRTPSASVNIPALPLLPRFELPELPELPSLPTVELPNLPPPPKIPKLFGAVEGVLNIMKLVTKVMCILKNSPFVPEWRAGDQIAFLTERNGYLPSDFINIEPPAFSYSMISAIKVTTYVNLEFEMEYILEAVKAITAPLDDATNNIVNMFDITLSNMDFSNLTPDDIEIDLGDELGLAPLSENPDGIYFIAALIATKFDELLGYTATHVDKKLSNDEFMSYVGNQLAQTSITSDPRTNELQKLWSDVQNLSYSREDAFIDSLKKNNINKFKAIGEIFSTEIEYSKQQMHELRTLGAPDFIQEVVGADNTRGQVYADLMTEYNIKTLDTALELVNGPSEASQQLRDDIKNSGDTLMTQVRGGLESYKQNTLTATTSPQTGESGGSCHSSGAYEYTYEGIYVKEDGRNYKLFDYTDPLNGDEIPAITDLDNDGDDDVLYLVGGTLYFKENKKNIPTTAHISTPLTLRSSDNKFYNGSKYYEAINGFSESSVSDGAINIEFSKPTNTGIKNFRVEYNTLIDRYIDDGNNLPRSAETHIVDAIADREDRAPKTETSQYKIYDNLAVLSYAGAMNNLKLSTEKLVNIKDDLSSNTQVTLTSDTALYAGDSRFTITYTYGGSDIEQSASIPAYSMIRFDRPAEIISVSGDAYVSLGILVDIEDSDILDYIGMPLLPGAHFDFSGDPSLLSSSAHIDIRYYNDSTVAMDMRDVSSYRLYDLGKSYGEKYRIRLEIPNDFYYARVAALQDDIYSTWSRQILLAPQSYSDTLAPQIGVNQKIRIPVYQQQTVDFTPYIYEDGGFTGISDVRIDFDTSVDGDGDGNTTNDRDVDNINITKTPVSLEVEFGEYDTLFERNILLALTDDNGNIGEQEILFEVYAPEPNISNVVDTKIYGRLDEVLTDEPVRIYRYRGGVVERLQKVDGTDISLTSGTGSYDFNASETASGLTLSYSGRTLASIDEYTGRIDIADVFTSTRVIPSNNPSGTSAYPEIQILLAGNPIFRQFVKMPLENISVVGDLSSRDDTGIYLRVMDQSRYNTFTIPLSVAYNAGSVSVYENTDSTKTPLLTVFRDGRMNIDESLYRVDYKTFGDDASFILVEKSTGDEIAQLVYHMEASYILR